MDNKRTSLFDVFYSLLKFCSLTDRGGKLSLTNIALAVVLVKIAISPFDYTGAVMLLPVIASYMHKRSESNKAAKEEAKVSDLKQLTDKVTELNSQVQGFKATADSVQKSADETKRLLSGANLSNAYVPLRDRPSKKD